MIDIAILGASGFVGAELLRLCAGHPRLRATRLFGESQAGQPLGALYPHLSPAYPRAILESVRTLSGEGPVEFPGQCALVFAALPHGESQKIAPFLLDSGVKFVDLGADFRLREASDYEKWYREPHSAPELLGRFVYGIPELHREAIAGAQAVAAAGCYPTSAILALKPLLEPDRARRRSTSAPPRASAAPARG